jgi:hypothetical protein
VTWRGGRLKRFAFSTVLSPTRKIRILRTVLEMTMREVPATEFARNFGRYREIVQR